MAANEITRRVAAAIKRAIFSDPRSADSEVTEFNCQLARLAFIELRTPTPEMERAFRRASGGGGSIDFTAGWQAAIDAAAADQR